MEPRVQEAFQRLAEGGPQAALPLFDALIAESPDAAQGETGLRVSRGLLLLDLERWAAAEADFRAWLDRAPEDAAAWLGLGRALAGAGQHEAALAAFDRAVAGRAGWSEAHWHRGCSRAVRMDLQGALDDFDLAFERLPAWARARPREARMRLARAQVQVALGLRERAGQDLKMAAAIFHARDEVVERDRILAVARDLGF